MPHKLSFRVISATSQDDYHKAIEIGNHIPSSKGWQSANFCLYPQDIVISLEHRCQIRKIQILSHQYLIATKIEFFVGDCVNNSQISLNNARFTRLGYVSLSDNEKTQFKARELKSVHVDAIGRFVKLIIHTNFINKYNHYNQVGIIAVNVIGDELFNSNSEEEENFNYPSKPDYIAPSDDLAFDMSVDPETGRIIRSLEKLKIQAAEDEEYDKAKKIRDMINYLKEVGEKLGKLEIEKQSASDHENFDRAKMKKEQIDEYRHRIYKELNLQDFLINPVYNRPKPIEKPPIQETELFTYRGYNQNNNAAVAVGIVEDPKPYYNAEDRPLPALKNQKIEVLSPRKNDIKEPVFETINDLETEVGNEEIDDDIIPGMTKSDLSEASDAIEVYGLPLVSRVYSKNWAHREDALLEVQKRLMEVSSETDKEDVKSEIRAVACLLKKSFKSRITQVVKVAMEINKQILVNLVSRLGIAKPELHFYLDKVTPEIFKCIEDNKVQIREMTLPYLVEMSQWLHVKNFPTIFSEAVKPFSNNILVRPGQIKTELLLELYSIHGLTNHYFTLDNFMKFSVQALQHKSAELRESAETLIVVLYRNEDKQVVRSYLPPDELKTRKNILYKRLFEKLDKIDGFAPAVQNQGNKEAEVRRQKESESLQYEQQKQKDQAKSKTAAPVNKKASHPKQNAQNEPQTSRLPNNPKVPAEVHKQPSQQPPAPMPQQQPAPVQAPQVQTQFQPQSNYPKLNLQEDLMADLDKTCIFCGEVNEALKENMDLHYWKNCPILRRCPHCKQAVEISSLTQHLLQECEQKNQFVQCQRCTEAILKSDDKHFTDATCNPADPNNSIRCPLCHENIPFGSYGDSLEALWQFHLMDMAKGCLQNPRRLMAVQRQNHEKNLNNNNNNSNKTASNPNAVKFNNSNANNNRKSQLPRAKGK